MRQLLVLPKEASAAKPLSTAGTSPAIMLQLLLGNLPKAAFDELGKCVDSGLGVITPSAQC